MAWLCIAFSVCFSKFVYQEIRLTTWEDIYGRSLVGSILSYGLMMFRNTSPFDIPTHIRNKLFIAEVCFIVAFGLVMVGLKDLSVLTSISILLVYFIFCDQILGLNLIFLVAAIGGFTILANPFGMFKADADQLFPVVGMGFAI